MTTTFLDAWSAGISSESISNKLNGKWVAIIVAAAGTVGAIIFPMDDITDFLYLIGSVFAPMIAVQIADFFILKKDNSNQGVSVLNLIVWLMGVVIYRMLMQVDIIVGNTIVDIMVTIIICIIVNKVDEYIKK